MSDIKCPSCRALNHNSMKACGFCGTTLPRDPPLSTQQLLANLDKIKKDAEKSARGPWVIGLVCVVIGILLLQVKCTNNVDKPGERWVERSTGRTVYAAESNRKDTITAHFFGWGAIAFGSLAIISSLPKGRRRPPQKKRYG